MPSYRSLVAQPSWRRLVAAASLSRLPITMGVFGLVLAGRSLGSFVLGGRLAATYTVAGALTAVWRGRRMDRGDLRQGLRRDGVMVALVATALAVCVHAHGPAILAAALALTLGVALAAVPGGYRAIVSSVVPADQLQAAFALDSVCVEICFIAGPAVAAATAWFAGPTGVFVVIAVCALGGSLAAGFLPSARRTVVAGRHGPAPHRTRVMRGVLAGTLAAGMGVGVLDVTLPALAVALGARAAVGGIFLTMMAVGSATTGLLLGPRMARGDRVGRRAAKLLLLFGVVILPMAASSGVGVVLVLALIGGAPFALMTISASVLIQRSVDQARTTEAYSLLNAGLLGGAAAGSALASAVLVPAGARITLLLAGAGPVLGAATLLAIMAGSRPRSPHQAVTG